PFLAPGVPAELTRAALRRAWSADPAIRDFVGLAENQWDFTAPGGAPGFGSLTDTEQIRQLLAKVIGHPEPEASADAAPEPPASETAENPPKPETTTASIDQSAEPTVAGEPSSALTKDSTEMLQCSSDANAPDGVNGEKVNTARRHGSALPR